MASSRAAPAAKRKSGGAAKRKSGGAAKRSAPEITAQVTLRGRFSPGTRVRLYKPPRPEALRHSEGDELVAVKRVDDDGVVRFTDADGVQVGGRYIIYGHVNGHPLSLRLRAREPGDELGQGLEPVGYDEVRHGDGTVAGIRGQVMAGTSPDRPAVPDHPAPGEEG